MPNRLAHESSPYLLQHKDNPVDWYPWGPEALARAKAEDKPMLVSIGYSACHWCHVMAHESFEDAAVAALMNEQLICIKVDREERPDIDSLCMTAVQAMTGQGGWPLNAFLTPEGVPFYGGTYFPPTDRQGMPSWRRVVDAVAETWSTKRDEILAQGDQIREALAHQPQLDPGSAEVDEDLIIRAVARLGSQFDNENGGFGAAPKFPQSPVLEFLLRAHHLLGDRPSLVMALGTLDQMAEGGLFDQIGGGFHRYAVDAIWLVPHFEKMLYDNAQLARNYTDAWRIEHKPSHRRIAEMTLDYLLREMRSPEGAFYSAQDADSEGVEGKFYVWNPEQIADALPEVDREPAMSAYGITPDGNFEGESIPTAPADPFDPEIERIRLAMLAARSKRFRPGTDTKLITAWNGMTIRALAEASRAFNRSDYRDAAIACAGFMRTNLDRDGLLHRTWDGTNPRIPAFLEDHAHLIDGLIALYQATFDLEWLDWAIDLANRMVASFSDDKAATFFDTSDAHDQLMVRIRDLQDGATPCGNSVAWNVLIRLGNLISNQEWIDRITGTLAGMSRYMEAQPLGFGRFLVGATEVIGVVREIAIASDDRNAAVEDLVDAIYTRFEPNALVALVTPEASTRIPWLADRPVRNGQATAYLCEQFVCLPPVTSPADLTAQLEMGTGMTWSSF